MQVLPIAVFFWPISHDALPRFEAARNQLTEQIRARDLRDIHGSWGSVARAIGVGNRNVEFETLELMTAVSWS